ncbi:carbohydrate-binding domain-containing protein [Paenibacillus sophorae]|uniref:Carbohydrate-binding domain-containing protein n=1 Tax=Paenibacillus sophorae TaxID=1333845 RepID=A0ABX8HJR9_9BACL|nr:carbohydrate-binding domain-containing protein [Paenibacillus sophorae]QWU17886.1 carbohydrate-binding domain-containing protein [Paenibacillus sophorae]
MSLVLIPAVTSCTLGKTDGDGISFTRSTSPTSSIGAASSTAPAGSANPANAASNGTTIALGDPINVSGTGAAVDDSTVNITAGGNYILSGSLTDGQVNINTKERVNLILSGISITNSSGPALLVTDAKEVTITLTPGTTNSLSDDGSTDENDAALFTNDTLVINGEGALVVTGSNNEGISSDDDIIVNGGSIKVTAPDDGINAHDDITINGGYVNVIADGDGIDSNGTVNINGGTVISQGSAVMGDGGIDAAGSFAITGGTVIASGNSLAAPDSDSTQASLFVKTGSTWDAGTLLHIEQSGSEIVTFAPAQSYRTLFYSSNQLDLGTDYQVFIGGSSSGNATDGLYSGGTYRAAGTTGISITPAITPEGTGRLNP